MIILLGWVSWVAGSSFQGFEYILPLLSGLQCFCREISWQPNGAGSLVINSVFLLLPLESLHFRHFNSNMSWCRFGILCASCTWRCVSFFRFGKFSVITSSNTFLIPFSLSFPSEIPIMHRLAHFILSHRDLILLFFFHMASCLLFWLGNFHCSVFQNTYSFLILSWFILLFIAFSLAFISANEFSNFSQLLFIVSSSFLEQSAFMLIALFNSFNYFHCLLFEPAVY